jgi:hypothetical protein
LFLRPCGQYAPDSPWSPAESRAAIIKRTHYRPLARLWGSPLLRTRRHLVPMFISQHRRARGIAHQRKRHRAAGRRQLMWLWVRLKQLSAMRLKREELLMKLRARKPQRPGAWSRSKWPPGSPAFTCRLDRNKLRTAQRREGRLSLAHQSHRARSGQALDLLSAARDGGRSLQESQRRSRNSSDLHQDEEWIEAHTFIAFFAYCLHVTLKRRLHARAPPTTGGRELMLTRYTQPEPDLSLLPTNSSSISPLSRRPKSVPLWPIHQTPCSADLSRCARVKSIT